MNTPFKSSRLEVVSSVSVVPGEPWDALAREAFYTSHRWLEFVERQPGAASEYVLAWHAAPPGPGGAPGGRARPPPPAPAAAARRRSPSGPSLPEPDRRPGVPIPPS